MPRLRCAGHDHLGLGRPIALMTGGLGSLDQFSDAERARIEALRSEVEDGRAYLQLQSTRPQTLGYGLTDSPLFQLAWIVEKFKEWTHASAELPEHAVDLDQLLANVSLYWFTRSGATAAHSSTRPHTLVEIGVVSQLCQPDLRC